ncbi:unnamed protein product [Ectocarpus sp. 6 AP-2014]
MYNNVGIRTPRGSGTSGHVMSNRSHVRAQAFRMGIDRNTGKLQARDWEEPPPRKANEELLDHQRKRKVEAKIFELQEAMADRGYSDAEIEEKVAEVRKGLEEREGSGQKASLLKGKKGGGAGGGTGAMDSHMRDVKKADDNRRMREAFGLGDDYAAGEAFDEEAQERKKEARRKEREAKDKEWEEKKAAKKAEEKKEKRRREKAGSDDDQDGQERGARKGGSRRGDSQEAERDSMMAKRAERFGASANERRRRREG